MRNQLNIPVKSLVQIRYVYTCILCKHQNIGQIVFIPSFSYEDGTYKGVHCPVQKKKNDISLWHQLDRATQFARELREGAISTEAYMKQDLLSRKHLKIGPTLLTTARRMMKFNHRKMSEIHFKNGH